MESGTIGAADRGFPPTPAAGRIRPRPSARTRRLAAPGTEASPCRVSLRHPRSASPRSCSASAAPVAYAFHMQAQTRNFRIVKDGVLYRSGQITLFGLKNLLHDYGIRTVVTLRDARRPRRAGARPGRGGLLPPRRSTTSACRRATGRRPRGRRRSSANVESSAK